MLVSVVLDSVWSRTLVIDWSSPCISDKRVSLTRYTLPDTSAPAYVTWTASGTTARIFGPPQLCVPPAVWHCKYCSPVGDMESLDVQFVPKPLICSASCHISVERILLRR